MHAIAPLSMIATVSFDSMLRRKHDCLPLNAPGLRIPLRYASIVLTAALYLLLVVNAAMAAARLEAAIDHHALIAILAYLPLLLLAVRWRLPFVVIAIALFHLLAFDRYLLLVQSRNAIVQSTPATQRLHSLLAGGGRYASLDSATDFMPPNMNAQMKLASVHTYDSLSLLRYQTLVRRLGGDVSNLGRSNLSIGASSIGSTDFQLTNIAALVTRKPLDSKAVALDAHVGGLYIYRVLERWGSTARLDLDAVTFDSDSAQLRAPFRVEKEAATIVVDQGDHFDLRLAQADAKPTLLVVSQAYQSDWQAEARYPGGWRSLRTLPVDDAFEGIIIPPGGDFIRLRFRPWIRWSWLGHVGFGILVLLLAYAWNQRRRRRAPSQQRRWVSPNSL